jgi:uncharacterized membrane protein (UPF0127 family)
MNIQINNINLPVTICATPEKIQKGIQGLESLNGEGYLFFLKDGEHSFWMKDCLIPIDIIFIQHGKITNIYPNCQPCNDENCERYIGFGDMVLEVSSGFCESNDIKKGEPVKVLP